jgi:hypothetical protein
MINIYGNSLAGLVSAYELEKLGIRCNYFCDIAKVASFFRGETVDGLHLDFGMNLLEFTSFNSDKQAKPITYSPWVRNDCGRFTSQVREFLQDLTVDSYEIQRPEIFFQGNFCEDFVFSNSLQLLGSLPKNDLDKIVDELSANCKTDSPLHATKKNQPHFSAFSYEEASIFNHGLYIHNKIILPFTQKLTNFPLDKVPGKYHRHLWFPLYYPETIIEAIKLKKWNLIGESTRFYYPKDKSFGSPIEKMISIVKDAKNITLRTKEEFKIYKDKADFNIVAEPTGDYLLPQSLFKIQELPKSKVSVFQFVGNIDCLEKVFSVINFVDSDVPFYRATLQSGGEVNGRVIFHVEAGTNDQLKPELIVGALKSIKVIKPNASLHFLRKISTAVVIPSVESVKNIDELCHAIQELEGNRILIGTASCFGTYSFNDQVIQGKKAAEVGTHYV